jgi:hypothetical protein
VSVVAPPGAVVSRDGDPLSSPSRAIPLAPSQLVEVIFGDFVLSARLAPVERVAGLRRPAPRRLGGLAVSAAAHVLCLALALALASHGPNADELSLSQLRIMRHLLEASAAHDPFTTDAPSRHSTLGSDLARPAAPSPPAAAVAVLSGTPSAAPLTTTSEPAPSGVGEAAGINVTDIGGLLASLERRLSHPLPGGIAQVPNTRDAPQDSLRPPYPLVSDGRLDKDAVRRVVRASTKSLLSCLGGAPHARGSAASHVAVTFTVGSFGQVVAAHDVGGDAPVDVRECIVKGFYALTFPPPERGTATLTYPLSLAPGD